MAGISRPEYSLSECFSKLYMFEATAHWYHLNTSSFAEHKALDSLVDDITDIKDKTLEILLGYTPKEAKCTVSLNLFYQGIESSKKLAQDLWKFADEYEKIYAEKGYGDLEQIFQTIKEFSSKFKYLLTLK